MQFNVQQLLASYGASLIQSVQQVAIIIPTSATTYTATINPIVTANAVIFYNGINPQITGVNPASFLAGLAITNPTTVTAIRQTADASNTTTVYATIVEFVPNVVKTNQSGIISLSAAQLSNTATISAVTTTNTVCFLNGSTCGTDSETGDWPMAIFLASSTSVELIRAANSFGVAAAGYYTILEFQPGILNSSTQAGTITISSGSSATGTISAVTPGQALVVANFTYQGNAGSTGLISANATLTNGTTITATINGSASQPTTIYYTVVEFKAINIRSMNRGTITIATSATSNTAAITAVNINKAITNYTGSTSAGSTNPATSSAAISLANATTPTATREASSGSLTLTVGYEILEFF